MKRSGWIKVWVLIVLLLLGAGSFGVFWFTRYRPVDLAGVEADLTLAKRAMQKTARSPESVLAVRQQTERLRLAREYNAALEAQSEAETLRRHWDAYCDMEAKAADGLAKAASGAQLEGGDRW